MTKCLDAKQAKSDSSKRPFTKSLVVSVERLAVSYREMTNLHYEIFEKLDKMVRDI